MSMQTHPGNALRCGLIGAAAVLLNAQSLADAASFRVAFAVVPGIEAIEAGNYDKALDILEGRRQQRAELIEDELSTLCAVYIVKRDLHSARRVCDEAVTVHDSEAAYNNRGVLRACTGDTAGALRDFSRIRILPRNVDGYIEHLKQGNPRLMASKNFELVNEAREPALQRGQPASLLAPGADVEDLAN